MAKGACNASPPVTAPIIKPLPGINNVSIICLSGLPVGLAIAVILDGVPLDEHPLRLLPDARLLLGLLLREPSCHDRHPHLMLCQLLETTRFGVNCFSARQHVLMLARSLTHALQILLRTPPLGAARSTRRDDRTLYPPSDTRTKTRAHRLY